MWPTGEDVVGSRPRKQRDEPNTNLEELVRGIHKKPFVKQLKKQLEGCLKVVPGHKHLRYLPRGDLVKLCGIDTVSKVVELTLPNTGRGVSARELSDLAQEIVRERVEIFGTLVLAKGMELLPLFRGYSDKELPFKEVSGQIETRDGLPVTPFRQLTDEYVSREFLSRQWQLHIARLTRLIDTSDGDGRLFDDNIIIPWTEFGPPITTGGFSRVNRVRIHPDHYDFVSRCAFYYSLMTPLTL